MVGGLQQFGTYFSFPYIGNFIIPTDELIFFRGVGQPPILYMYIVDFPQTDPNARFWKSFTWFQ